MTARTLLNIAIAAWCGGALAAQEKVLPADAVLRELKAGNDHHVAKRYQHPHQTVARQRELTDGQNPHAIVLSCADSRVAPEIIVTRGAARRSDRERRAHQRRERRTSGARVYAGVERIRPAWRADRGWRRLLARYRQGRVAAAGAGGCIDAARRSSSPDVSVCPRRARATAIAVAADWAAPDRTMPKSGCGGFHLPCLTLFAPASQDSMAGRAVDARVQPRHHDRWNRGHD